MSPVLPTVPLSRRAPSPGVPMSQMSRNPWASYASFLCSMLTSLCSMLTSNNARERALVAERALLDDLVGPPEIRRRDREALALSWPRAHQRWGHRLLRRAQ